MPKKTKHAYVSRKKVNKLLLPRNHCTLRRVARAMVQNRIIFTRDSLNAFIFSMQLFVFLFEMYNSKHIFGPSCFFESDFLLVLFFFSLSRSIRALLLGCFISTRCAFCLFLCRSWLISLGFVKWHWFVIYTERETRY